jgi:methyltransferase (TIGR00027 family)
MNPNAWRNAVSRATHQLLDRPRLFDDPLAVAIAGEEASLTPARGGVEMRSHRALIAARNRHAEDELNAGVARGALQYVILGAGLDTYAYRNPNANLRVFEVDHPATQVWKRTRLKAAGIAIPPSLAFVPTEFEKGALQPALEDAGFSTREISVFSWLGVCPDSSPQGTLTTLAFIGSLPKGSGVVFDYAVSRSALDPVEEMSMDALASRITGPGESVHLRLDSRALHRALACAGFHEIEDLGPAQIDERYFGNRADGLRPPSGLAHLVSARV